MNKILILCLLSAMAFSFQNQSVLAMEYGRSTELRTEADTLKRQYQVFKNSYESNKNRPEIIKYLFGQVKSLQGKIQQKLTEAQNVKDLRAINALQSLHNKVQALLKDLEIETFEPLTEIEIIKSPEFEFE